MNFLDVVEFPQAVRQNRANYLLMFLRNVRNLVRIPFRTRGFLSAPLISAANPT